MRKSARRSVAVLAAAGLALAGCGSSNAAKGTSSAGPGGGLRASAPGVTPTTIKVGLIYSATGVASSEYSNLDKAVKARIDAQNAAGGVDGRKIQLVVEDDQSNPAQDLTAAQQLVSQDVFGVIGESSFLFASYRYLQQHGIPVTGSGYDGEEWGQQPNTNMFSSTGPLDPNDPQYTQPAQLMKDDGVTSVASFGYGQSPSSAAAARGFAFAAKTVGLKVGYLDTSIPFGTVNVTSLVLSMKQQGVNGLFLPLDANTNFAIVTAAKQAGIDLKFVDSVTGYGQPLLDDAAAVQAAQGVYFPPAAAPVELHTKATEAMQAAFAEYAQFRGVPDYQWYVGWLGTDLMIKGLEVAGRNPTRASFIHGLHGVTDYSGGGLLASPVSYSLADFGKAPKTQCGWYTVLKGSKFVVTPSDGKPVCGTLIPNSNQL